MGQNDEKGCDTAEALRVVESVDFYMWTSELCDSCTCTWKEWMTGKAL